MNEKKYILTDENIVFMFCTLHRIQAVKDFGNIKAGDLGGWIESEENLSQEGTCWVYGEAEVFGKARVCDEAEVFGKARIYGEARVFGKACVYDEAQVFGEARVYGEAKVFGKARVCDEARVFNMACISDEAQVFCKAHICDEARVFNMACISYEAKVFDKAHIYGKARVFGKARVGGVAEVYGKALISGTTTLRTTAYVQSQYDLLSIENIGSRNDTTTFYKTKEGGIDVACGCFRGSIEEFEKAVNKTHGDNEHGRVYRNTINYVKYTISAH